MFKGVLHADVVNAFFVVRCDCDGHQEPGAWKRIVLYVENLDSTIAALQAAGIRFRGSIEVGSGG